MKIIFVNHSSFIIEHQGVRIICDPWLEGSVFNNGWSLISKTKLSYGDFRNIGYIWFSHEHPDHFHPLSIKKIPTDFRKNITVLFQKTIDGRVIDFCSKQGFREVLELEPNKWYNLGADLKILCAHYSEGDSWICFKGGGKTYLNTNDCGIEKKSGAEKILNKIGGSVDVLLTQFSYAYWAGNPEDTTLRENMADKKLGFVKLQCDTFRPKVTIPIASYVYFSHIENCYLNDKINTPRKTFKYLKNNTQSLPVVLYNGDEYSYPGEHDSNTSIENYERDFESIKQNGVYEKINTISIQQLKEAAEKFRTDLNKNNWFYLKKILKPTNIFIRDYNRAYTLSLKNFSESGMKEEFCDVSLTSENLQFCFLYPYGLVTTQINGRLRTLKQGCYRNFYNFFRINQYKSRGINPNNPLFLAKVVYRKLFGKIEYHEIMNVK